MLRHASASARAAVSLPFLLGCGCGDAVGLETAVEGKTVYEQRCAVCHDAGVDGAPILGDTASWTARAQQPDVVLRQHLVQGYFLMPAKGANPEITPEEIGAAIRYITAMPARERP